jgi:hypothetical protein
MESIWAVGRDGDRVDDAADGDYVLCSTEGDVAVGRVDGGTIAWIGHLDPSLLPAGALDAVEPSGGATRPPEQDALLRAARGVETAQRERGA